MEPTPTRDLSVVLQGPVHRTGDSRAGLNLTAHCCHSIRHALPGCEIIVSTWDGERRDDLDCDQFLTSPDPGGCDYMGPFSQNVNRQNVSTLAGLRAATRPFAVKLRSDMIVEFPAFLEYQHRYPNRGRGAVLFRDKVVASSMGTVNFRDYRVLFSLSDFFFFGRTADLITLFDVPPVVRPAGAPPHSAPYVTEQYLMLRAMNKAGVPVEMTGPFPGAYRSYLRKYALTWERFLFANFTLAHPSHLGLMMSRRLYVQLTGYPWAEVDRLYDLHCCRPTAGSRGLLPLPRRDLRELLGCYLFPPR